MIELYMASPRTGKSNWAQMVEQLSRPNIEVITQAEVDGKMWYTVRLNMPTAQWLRQQDRSLWCEMPGYTTSALNLFDIHETLYTLLMLKWKQ